MYLDKQDFERKCTEVTRDIKNQEITSSVWACMGMGAIAGFVLSCIKLKRPVKAPIIGSFRKAKEGI
jgi:hypothetical protein